VGETISVQHLIEALREDLPQKKFVISTVTATGNKIAKAIAAERDYVTYLPLDLSFIVRKVIDRINPSIFIITETELWPNLIYYLSRKDIPIVIVNGRISDNSFNGYLRIKFLIGPLLNRINTFCVQTQKDADRLCALGLSRDKIKITGNMKFDIKVKDYTELKKDYTDYRMRFGLSAQDRLFIAASTHQGEEEIILSVYQQLLEEVENIKLLIVPRHPERTGTVEKLVAKFNFRPQRISYLSPRGSNVLHQIERPDHSTVFILDTIGQLMYFYAISDIVFVGGSLVKKGGHNILEPASLSKPMLIGPHMFNFLDITNLFLKANALIMVRDADELRTNIRNLLCNESKINELGHLAKGIILKNRGATLKNKEIITGILRNIV
jgi:3-deoxy-D-manno-octulosonic-acid transferase